MLQQVMNEKKSLQIPSTRENDFAGSLHKKTPGPKDTGVRSKLLYANLGMLVNTFCQPADYGLVLLSIL